MSSDSIQAIAVTNNASQDVFKARWGSTVYDYKLNEVPTAFQDLMVAISEHRANAVESEVTPMTKRMRDRNAQLEKLGTALSELTKIQSTFKSDMSGDEDMSGWLTIATGNLLKEYCSGLGIGFVSYSSWDDVPDDEDERPDFYYCSGKGYSGKKKSIDALVEKVKNVIDSLNNAAQTDMTRLQSLVDRRDESYTTATTLMSSISDTTDNAIRNLS